MDIEGTSKEDAEEKEKEKEKWKEKGKYIDMRDVIAGSVYGKSCVWCVDSDVNSEATSRDHAKTSGD